MPSCSKSAVPALDALARRVTEPAQRGERERLLVAVLDVVRLGDRELERLARASSRPARRCACPSTRLSTGRASALPPRPRARERARRELGGAVVLAAQLERLGDARVDQRASPSDSRSLVQPPCLRRAATSARSTLPRRASSRAVSMIDSAMSVAPPAARLAVRLAQQRLGLVEPALGREDLADVEGGHGHAAACRPPDPTRRAPGGRGRAPRSSARRSRRSAEVVEHAALADEIPELP